MSKFQIETPSLFELCFFVINYVFMLLFFFGIHVTFVLFFESSGGE